MKQSAQLSGWLTALLLCLLCLVDPPLTGAVTTTGVLTQSETWSGEVIITGDVTVPSGMELTIEPGAVVRFQALRDDQCGGGDNTRSELIINGLLLASGTEANPIIFTSTSASPAPGDWGGIQVWQGTTTETPNPSDEMAASEAVTLSHATIEYAVVGIATGQNAHVPRSRSANAPSSTPHLMGFMSVKRMA